MAVVLRSPYQGQAANTIYARGYTASWVAGIESQLRAAGIGSDILDGASDYAAFQQYRLGQQQIANGEAAALAALGIASGASVVPLSFQGLGDDSAAFAAAIVTAQTTGLPIILTGSRWRLSNLTPILLNQSLPLHIVAAPGCLIILDAQGVSGSPAARFMTVVGGGGLIMEGDITFANWSEGAIIGSDGVATAAFGNAWTGAIGIFMLRDVKWQGCTRGIYMTTASIQIGKLVLLGNIDFEGQNSSGVTVAVGGIMFDCPNLPHVYVDHASIRNINSTSIGYGSDGSPLRNGNGQGFVIGGNIPGAFQNTNTDWQIGKITVEHMLDTRNVVNGTSPLIEGIRLVGASGATVSQLIANDIASPNALKDCSGVYLKLRGGSVALISGYNAGQSSEGSVLIKGATEYGFDPGGVLDTTARGDKFVIGLINLRTDFGSKTVGLGIQTSNVTVNTVVLEGYGDLTATYPPIYTFGARCDNIELLDVKLKNCVGSIGARITHNGRNFAIRKFTLDGLSGAAGSRTFAISFQSVNAYTGTGNPATYGMVNFSVDDIDVSGLIDQGNGSAVVGMVASNGNVDGFRVTRIRRAESAITTSGAVGTATATANSTTLTINTATSGTFAVGQLIILPGIAPGTTIAALGTSTGGTGTVIMSAPALAAASGAIQTATPQKVATGLYAGGTTTGTMTGFALNDNDLTNVNTPVQFTGSVVPTFVSTANNLPQQRSVGSGATTLRTSDQSVLGIGGAAMTITIPPASASPMPVGHILRITATNAGALTIAAGTGVTINVATGSSLTPAQYKTVTLEQTAANVWVAA